MRFVFNNDFSSGRMEYFNEKKWVTFEKVSDIKRKADGNLTFVAPYGTPGKMIRMKYYFTFLEFDKNEAVKVRMICDAYDSHFEHLIFK